MVHLRRRQFFTLLGGAAVAWPMAARAQQRATVPHVGILNYASAQDIRVSQFHDALRRVGYVDGKNLAVTYRWADGALERLPQLAAELVAGKIDVIIALGPAVWAAKRATTMVPIVIAFSGDPVGDGVVSSFARPGGNITGFSYMSTDLAAKRLELLSNAFSKESRIGVLYNPQEPATRLEMQETETAARALGVTLVSLAVWHPDDLDQAFTAAHERADALLVFTHGFAVLNRARIMALAARHRLPTLYGWRDFVDEGGLMSYGPDIDVLVRQAASYVDRIIRGERPGDLPVQQPTRLRLVINVKTAKALGLEIPDRLLALADEVIE
jgi:putative tryptophan/tyrosine transport system substrate-binding protein